MFPLMPFVGLHPKLHYLKGFLQDSRVRHAEKVWHGHFGSDKIYNREGWAEIFKLGYLPLSIKAVPEGTVVPTRNVLMTIENTDPRFPWLTNWVETLLMQVWYPITVAAQSRDCKILIRKYLELTGCSLDGLDYKLHDFGFRGVTCIEQAMIGGAAHLGNFRGTDTGVALDYLEYYYAGVNSETECVGNSIPASEHSIHTSWGRQRESESYQHMLDQFPDGLFAAVSDSYNIYDACRDHWGTALKPRVLSRDGCVVIRPDSGHPPLVVVGCLNILGDRFGFTKNAKGYKVLDPHVRLIQGDGVNYEMIRVVLHAMYEAGWAADNVAFGMGGALLQQLNRDTQRMAIKCSSTICDGVETDVSKDPFTDINKKSLAGRLALIKQDGELVTAKGPHKDDILIEVFRDGQILDYPTLAQIRERSAI